MQGMHMRKRSCSAGKLLDKPPALAYNETKKGNEVFLMIKIGFIDYYLDEWHANNYPAMIEKASGGEMAVAYAYGKIDSPIGGITNKAWCEKYGIQPVDTIEELVEMSDALVVLSPDNCEMHEELCKIPLASGKRCYVDKTFAPDYPTAKRIFANAEAHGTPCYSTSALRFADEYRNIATDGIRGIQSWGPAEFETYSIHQLEPLAMLMKAAPKRVMYLPGEGCYSLVIEYADGRHASVNGFRDGSPFMMNIAKADGNCVLTIESPYFDRFIANLVDFFRTGDVKVPHEETLHIMALRGAGLSAQATPGEWVEVIEG